MSVRKYYINGIGMISPQRTFNNSEFLPEVIVYDQNVLMSVAPDFKEYLTPVQLRRLGRMLRIGISAATICVRDSGEGAMDGIVTATGYGFLRDTAVFLTEILDQNEQHIAPTHFMQSTYNSLAGLVALSIQCKGSNNTYVSRGSAFETALDDVLFQLNEDPSQRLLLGSYDEADETQYRTHLRKGYFKKEFVPSNKLQESKTPGTIQGEGSAFFCVSGKPSSTTWCAIGDVMTLYKPDQREVNEGMAEFLQRNALTSSDVDVVLNGSSGDVAHDAFLAGLVRENFASTPQIFFKNLSGEYCTSPSFAVWLGASILKKQTIPSDIATRLPEKLQTILIINQYLGTNHSYLLLRGV